MKGKNASQEARRRIILASAMIMFMLFSINFVSAAACGTGDTAGMVSYWKLDEASGTNVVDSVAGINNGTDNGATVNQAGRVGTAYSFDGINDYVNLSDIDAALFPANFTIIVWVNYTIADYNNIIFSNWKDGKGLDFQMINNVVAYVDNTDSVNINGDTATTPNHWYHVALVYKTGKSAEVYLNGALDKQVNHTGSAPANIVAITNNHGVRIGWNTQGAHYFHGLIDEVAIFNRTLTATEISNLYDLGVAGSPYCGGADTTPPASVTNLANKSSGYTWIYWNWTNPADADFDSSIIFIDSVNVANTSNNYYNATGLDDNTEYTITLWTKDITGNVNNTDVNSSAMTLYEPPIIYPSEVSSILPYNKTPIVVLNKTLDFSK
jgi:hypothetical protein